MQFPIFYPPHIGDGAAIGAEAVTHVVISHGIAIGVVALAALAEYLGVKRASAAWEDFARRSTKYAAIVITSVGAVTGVGIWFFASAFVPRAIGSMLRIFFWPWFAEWLVFAFEVGVLLAYYFLWERWQGQRKSWHLRLGLAYAGLAILSALLITGILGFMLTSDGWPWSQRFWQAFLNPSFAPQFFVRIGGSFALGSLFCLGFLYLCCREPAFQRQASRLFGAVLLVSLAVTAVCCWWYFAVAPSAFKSHGINRLMLHALPAGHLIFWLMNGFAVAVLAATAACAGRGRLLGARLLIVPAIIVSIAFVAEFEYIREFMRGPYVMPGYMYANGVLIDEHEYLSRHGLLRNSYWYRALDRPSAGNSAGSFLFAQNCATCHTLGGVNSIAKALQGRPQDGIYAILGHTHEMVPWMPPFTGTPEERRILAGYLHQLTQGKVKRTASARFPEPERQ
jgi:hypothetical protein